jgi:penicillin-binding protein 1A
VAKKPAKKKKTAKKKSSAQSPAFFSGPIGEMIAPLIKWGLVIGLWISIAVGILFAWYASELPDITEAMIFERRPTVTIMSNDGHVLDRYGDIKGKSITVEELPAHVVYAVLATEDRRFYQHHGVDPIGILRAFAVNILHGSYVQGGSTITQQLAKNLFLSRDRTLKRKIQEAMLAIWLEQKLTKDEILSAYLNRVYMGSGAYGIDAAAKVYFNKSAREVSLREAAMLAGVLKAPSRYSPSANPDLAAQRALVVLNAMVDAGFIEEKEVDAIKNNPPAPRRKPSSGETIRYFTDYVVSQLPDLVGETDKDLIVETTLDADIQKESEEAITKGILRYGEERHIGQGAAVVLRLDGAIVAMVGGRDYMMSEYNRVTNALRSPGSSFKPIVYLTALENGWKMDDTIVDEPITEGRYRPQNYGGEYYGEVTLIEALTRSLNTVSVKLMRSVGPDAVISMARRLGITADLEPNLSLALGSSGVPVLQMATAYATLGRGGLAVEPFSIVKISDADGNVYYERPREHTARQVVPRKYVYDISTMMQSVVENGTGQAARLPYLAAGKTGTSQDFRDAWFIGFTNRYAAAVWFGNDDNSPMKRVTGGLVPAPAWREIMLKAMEKQGPDYGTVTAVTEDFSFHDLMGRLLGGGGDTIFWNSREKEEAPEGPGYTPLGRHQWDLND